MFSLSKRQMNAYKELLEIQIRKRQLYIWNEIIKHYEVEDSLNSQIQKWIREGTFSEHVCSLRIVR
jgi:hypothetical protein